MWIVNHKSSGLKHIYQTDGASRTLSTIVRMKSPIYVRARAGNSSSKVASRVLGPDILDWESVIVACAMKISIMPT